MSQISMETRRDIQEEIVSQLNEVMESAEAEMEKRRQELSGDRNKGPARTVFHAPILSDSIRRKMLSAHFLLRKMRALPVSDERRDDAVEKIQERLRTFRERWNKFLVWGKELKGSDRAVSSQGRFFDPLAAGAVSYSSSSPRGGFGPGSSENGKK